MVILLSAACIIMYIILPFCEECITSILPQIVCLALLFIVTAQAALANPSYPYQRGDEGQQYGKFKQEAISRYAMKNGLTLAHPPVFEGYTTKFVFAGAPAGVKECTLKATNFAKAFFSDPNFSAAKVLRMRWHSPASEAGHAWAYDFDLTKDANNHLILSTGWTSGNVPFCEPPKVGELPGSNVDLGSLQPDLSISNESTVSTQPIYVQKPEHKTISDFETISTSETAKTTNTFTNRPVADKWALVVGVGKFADSSIPPLKYAAKDAQDFADFLVKEQHFAADHVRVLTDEKATQREILSEIGNKYLPRVVRADDLVVLFYSSHGSPADKDIRSENFLVAYDTDKMDLWATGISMQELTRILRERVLANRILLVMDACHSGGGANGAKDAESVANFNVRKIELGEGQCIVSSSDEKEKSWESRRYQNGVFTHCLIDGLRREAGLSRAVLRAKNAVLDEVQADQAAQQNPVMNQKNWTGSDIVLSAVPSAPRVMPDSVKALLAMASLRGQTTELSNTTVPPAPRPSNEQTDFGPYLADLSRRIKRAWFPEQNTSSNVGVQIRIAQGGTLTSTKVLNSSSLSAEGSAVHAIENAAPFRPLPSGAETVGIKVWFRRDVSNTSAFAVELDPSNPSSYIDPRPTKTEYIQAPAPPSFPPSFRRF